MADMLVKLYSLKDECEIVDILAVPELKIKRALAPDRRKVLGFVKSNFDENYVDECKAAFSNNPITCYIATQNKEIVGFACYEATAKDFFGPMGVCEIDRNRGIGRALLIKSLLSMREMGYGYAIIGYPTKSAVGFYEKVVKAQIIEDTSKGIYKRMIDSDE